MDGLSAVLDQIKLKSAVYFNSAFSPEWGMDVPRGPFAQFHIVVEGDCCFKCGNHETTNLRAGDILIFPNGTAHWVAHTALSNKVNGAEVVSSIKDGQSIFSGDISATKLICGHFEFDRTVDHPFISSLPDLIHIKEVDAGKFDWILSIANLLIHETEEMGTGSTEIVERLAEALFISAIRYYIDKNNNLPFLAALYDKNLSAALQQMHSYPEKDWSLSKLSVVAGMSRSSFANHFREKVGQTPMHYLAHWRMLIAQRILEEGDESISSIAVRVGYSSEIAFSRVFKKLVCQTPGRFRRELAA